MDIASNLHFLVVLSIPLVGGAFLYCELRWNKFAGKSVAYGFMYAIFALILLLADFDSRLFGRLADLLTLGSHQTLQYTAPSYLKDEAMFLDCLELKKRGAEVIEAKEEGQWCVINYRADKKLLNKSSSLQKLLLRKEVPVLKSASKK